MLFGEDSLLRKKTTFLNVNQKHQKQRMIRGIPPPPAFLDYAFLLKRIDFIQKV